MKTLQWSGPKELHLIRHASHQISLHCSGFASFPGRELSTLAASNLLQELWVVMQTPVVMQYVRAGPRPIVAVAIPAFTV